MRVSCLILFFIVFFAINLFLEPEPRRPYESLKTEDLKSVTVMVEAREVCSMTGEEIEEFVLAMNQIVHYELSARDFGFGRNTVGEPIRCMFMLEYYDGRVEKMAADARCVWIEGVPYIGEEKSCGVVYNIWKEYVFGVTE